MGQYYTLSILGVKGSDEDHLSYLCFEAGAGGVSEVLDFTQEQDNYEPVTVEKEVKDLNVYFESLPAQSLLEDLKQRFPYIKISQSVDDERDWREEWKKGLKAFALTDDVWIVPSWLEAPQDVKKIIKIDPGMAFGTGTHETTNIAAEFISNIIFKETDSLLDVGTGTGILAILAGHYNCQSSIGIEIEKVAREVAKENVELNDMNHKIKILDQSLEQVEGQFNFVIANIIDGILIQLADELKKHMAPGGEIILTGILESRRDQFIERFGFAGFDILGQKQKGEWVGFHLKKL